MFGNCFCLLKENSFEKGEKQVVKQDLAKAKKWFVKKNLKQF